MNDAALVAAATAIHTRRSTFAACVISATGSLPLHMMALLVALAIRQGDLGVAEAGRMSACYMLGVLAGSLVWPAAGAMRVTRAAAIAAVVIVVGALLAGSTLGKTTLFGSWVVVGLGCSVLNLLGSTYAAAHDNKASVLRLRLALVLLASASVIVLTDSLTGFASFSNTIAVLAVVFAVVAVVCVPRYTPPPETMPGAMSDLPRGRRQWDGAPVVALFFAGQSGFAAYAVHLSASNGIPATALPLAYAACKVVTALVLMRQGLGTIDRRLPSMILSIVLGSSVVLMAFSTALAAFVVALLAWEIALNLQSTRLQSKVLAGNPRFAGPWLPAFIWIGAGIGPLVHGATLAAGLGIAFVVFSVSTAFLPVMWARLRSSAE